MKFCNFFFYKSRQVPIPLHYNFNFNYKDLFFCYCFFFFSSYCFRIICFLFFLYTFNYIILKNSFGACGACSFDLRKMGFDFWQLILLLIIKKKETKNMSIMLLYKYILNILLHTEKNYIPHKRYKNTTVCSKRLKIVFQT